MLASSATAPGRSGGVGYRRTGFALFVLGALAGGGAVYAPSDTLQELLVAFAGAGLFGAALVYWVRPGATSVIDPSERVYTALAETGAALARDLDLADRRVYLPAEEAPEGFAPAYLAIPAGTESSSDVGPRRPVFGSDERVADLEPDGTVDSGNTARVDSGITVYSTGAALFDAYEAVAATDLSTDPVEVGDLVARRRELRAQTGAVVR